MNIKHLISGKSIAVHVKLSNRGFDVFVGKDLYPVTYPLVVWNSFPQNIRLLFAETIAYYFTYHLYFIHKKPLEYHFPPSLAQSFFTQGLLMILPEAILEIPKAKFSLDRLLKSLYQSQHDMNYIIDGTDLRAYSLEPYITLPKTVVIPLSLGKDSLLTFGVTRELGLQQKLFFFVEPHSTNEEKNKKTLGRKFMDEFSVPITFVPVTLGALREKSGTLWGWDMMLAQYTLLLLPYLYHKKAKFLLWSQEQNYNTSTPTDFGIHLTMNYDETSKWRLQLTSLLSYFGSPAIVASCNEPLMEFSDTYILHHRYPEVAKYQLSCDGDHKNARISRWCNACEECARFYVYLLAIGMDPKRVGLSENMLKAEYVRYYSVFKKKPIGKDYVYQFEDDFLFALFLVYRRGIQGAVINQFKKQLLNKVQAKLKNGFSEKFFKLYPTVSVPYLYKVKILSIYEEELISLRSLINSFL